MKSHFFSGKRAVITGASSGIGADFATLLAEQGAPLVLVARRREKMEVLRKNLLPMSPSIEIIEADLSNDVGVTQLIQKLESTHQPVEVLINNAGFGITGRYDQTPWSKCNELCNLNIVALARLSHWAAAGMVARRRGYLLNVASTAAFQPVPGMALYGASKSFVSDLTLAIHQEVKGLGVNVSCLHPGKTETEFFERALMGQERFMKFPGMSSRLVAQIGLKGLAHNRPMVVAGLLNQATYQLSRFSPIELKLWLTERLFRTD